MRKTNSLNEKENAGHTKKTWQTPEIYILGTSNVNGGTSVNTFEIRTGHHKIGTTRGFIGTASTANYNHYHS